jgi:single-strand DNA-binding protein
MINKVTLIGNLGKDVEVQELESGSLLGRGSIATHENYIDKNGEWQKKTEWHNIVFWESLARRAGEQLKKGRLVYIEGKLVSRNYKDKDDQERRLTEVRVNYFRALDRPDELDESAGDAQDSDHRTDES